MKELLKKTIRMLPGDLVAAMSGGDLEKLRLHHATDKYSHGYLRHYSTHFRSCRRRAKTVIEIGIGGYGDAAKGGNSLRLWRDYFPNAHIHGIDIEDKKSHDGARITTHQGSQADPEFLRSVIDKTGAPDIVIDDGSHVNEHILASFEALFPLLKEGGLYVIEDMQTAYLPRYGGDFTNLNNPQISTVFAKSMVDAVNYKSIPKRRQGPWDGAVSAVSVYPKICFIEKRMNDLVLTPYERELLAEAEAEG